MCFSHMANGHDLWYGRFEDLKFMVVVFDKFKKNTALLQVLTQQLHCQNLYMNTFCLNQL